MTDSGDMEFQASVGPPTQPEYLRSVYANHLNVTFSPHDFRFTFSLLEMPLEVPEDAEAGGRIELRPHAVANVVVPASMMHALMSLLQQQFSRYLTQFGPPGLDPEGPGGRAS